MADRFIQVTAGVIARAGTVLVCQRPAGGHHPGKWEFPGGKVEPGESLEDGMRRELREELAIEAEVGAVLWRTAHQYPGRDPFVLTFFAIPQCGGAISNRCFTEIRWVAVGDLGGLDFLDGDRDFIALLQSGRVRLLDCRRRAMRLQGYDYAQAGAYFVTLCTHNRDCLFGDIVDGRPRLGEFGAIVAEEWSRSTDIRREIELDEWVVMPNHLHAIVVITAAGKAHGRAPLHPRARSLSSLVAGFKAATTKRINARRGTPGEPVWQRNYSDHIIRNEKSLDAIRQYIQENPLRWADDDENPANLKRRRL
jgi:putative transposase